MLLAFYLAATFLPPEFWPVHLVLYGPRWIAGLPLVLLVPVAAWRRSLWSMLALTVGMLSFLGVWGFNIPWKSWFNRSAGGVQSLRVLTCNVQGNDLKADVLADFIAAARPDVVCLQECNLTDPSELLGAKGWYWKSVGEHCLASRYPLRDFEELRREDKSYRIMAVRAILERAGKPIPFVSVHLMTPRRGLQPIVDRDEQGIDSFRKIASVQRMESELVHHWIGGTHQTIVLAGDFNLTCEHALFRRDWSGYQDAFSQTSWGLGHTMFTRQIGLRIDHILCGREWTPLRCEVGPNVGSAHLPVVADLVESR
jgi:endonuclease/exonuclease/phosphatase (EEP) superfamily protein YafD